MKKIKQYKMKEIAKMAGVSVATVSNAINNSRKVKNETKEKVLKIVQKLNYKPNASARNLKMKRSRSVAVVMPDIANPVFAQHIEGIEEVARNRDYEVLVIFTYYDVSKERDYVEDLIGRTSGSFIFVSGFDNYEYMMYLFRNKIKFVLLDREIREKKIPSVTIDNFAAMRDMVSFLINNGHKRISYVSYPLRDLIAVKKRFQGYRAALNENNITYDPELVIMDDLLLNELNCGYTQLKAVLKSKNIPTALVAASDYIAIALMRVLKQLKIRIPDEVSVAGFDNIQIGSYVEPSLTTVSQPAREMGKAAMNLMIDFLEGKKIHNKNIVFPTEFIERQSTLRKQEK